MDTELTRYIDEMKALLGKLELRAKGEYPKPTGWKAREWRDGYQDVLDIHPSAQRVIWHRNPQWAADDWTRCVFVTPAKCLHANPTYEHAEFLQISSEPAP